LLEVLIAALVLSAGLLGLAGLQIAGMKTTHNSYQVQQGTWIVHDLLERMRANRSGVVAGNYNTSSFATCGTAPTCANAANCTATETAAIDIYQIYCGAGGKSSGIRNELVNGALTVSCSAVGCNNGGVRIRLQWDERNASRNAGANTEQFNIQLNAIL
jgi:type IV pilus modification protein PilV